LFFRDPEKIRNGFSTVDPSNGRRTFVDGSGDAPGSGDSHSNADGDGNGRERQ